MGGAPYHADSPIRAVMSLLRPALAVLAAVLLLPRPSSAQVVHPDPAMDAVLAPIRTFFEAFAARDSVGMASTLDPAGRLVVTGFDREGNPRVTAYGLGQFVGIIAGQTGPALVETWYNPRVTIHDNLASAWLDYDLFAGPRLDHCGEDLFQLARLAGGWKITAIADTQRRDCGAPAGAPDAAALRALFEQGVSYETFVERADQRKERWQANRRLAVVPSDLAGRAAAVPGSWRLLVVAEAGCSDSADTIPYLDALFDLMPGLEVRLVRSVPGRAVLEAFPSPDGRAATPTFVLTDADFGFAGVFVERPAALQAWAVANRAAHTEAEFVRRKTGWYDFDRGESTMAQVLGLVERAAVRARIASGG